MATVHTQIESARGCGYRRRGAYLISTGVWSNCGIFPIELNNCPCCFQGIKFSRGFSWVSKELLKDAKCKKNPCKKCSPFYNDDVTKLGLLWTGEKFYPTPADFIKEANMAGLSKRINAVPKDLVLGETWVLLAHNKAITVLNDEAGNLLKEPQYKKGIFAAFIPTGLEYIVGGDESEEELDKLEKRGFKIIKVIKDVESQIPLDKQLDDYEVEFYKPGDRNKQCEIVQAHSEKSARQAFKARMSEIKTRVMSVEKV